MKKKILLILLTFFTVALSLRAQENRYLSSQPVAFNAADGKQVPASGKFEMEQNSPNPFTIATEIDFSTPYQTNVEFKIVNLLGKQIYYKVMIAEAGRNTIKVESDDFIPGVYVYSLSNGSQTITRRMVISRK